MKTFVIIHKIHFLKTLKNSAFCLVIHKNYITTTNTYLNKFIIK